MELNVAQKIEGRVKRRKCNTRNASFQDFPEEIQIEILSRLPSKTLSRCKCVSKHWNNDRLTLHAFLLRHTRSYDKQPKLAFVATSTIWRRGSVISFELNDDNTPKTTKSRIRAKDVYFFTKFCKLGDIYMSNICNFICLFTIYSLAPVLLLSLRTGDFIQLPAITMTSWLELSWYALGFDPENKVFKVLSRIYCCREKRITKAVTLTIGSKHWKPIDRKFLLNSDILSWGSTGNLISLDGMIYWVHQNRIGDFFMLTVDAFDFNREEFRDYELVKIPIKDGEFLSKLTSSKGCPTLLLRKKESDEIQEWTLFNHKKSNAAWNWKSFTLHDFPTEFSYDYTNWTSATGGSFLLRRVSSGSQVLVKPQEHDDFKYPYLLYDFEIFAIENIVSCI